MTSIFLFKVFLLFLKLVLLCIFLFAFLLKAYETCLVGFLGHDFVIAGDHLLELQVTFLEVMHRGLEL